MNRLKQIYFDKGITTCELNYIGCSRDQNLTFAHKHKRVWYKNRQELLESFDETILACVNCHDIIEPSRKLTKKEFERLRDADRIEALIG